jgi:hypothetical protein
MVGDNTDNDLKDGTKLVCRTSERRNDDEMNFYCWLHNYYLFCYHQSSVLKDDTGSPSVPYSSPTTKFLKAYLTATGSFTFGEDTNTVDLNITALPG